MTIYAECERYDYDACAIPFNFPSWNWQDGIEGKTCLRLARILTTAVNSTCHGRPYDGNLGLSVPG